MKRDYVGVMLEDINRKLQKMLDDILIIQGCLAEIRNILEPIPDMALDLRSIVLAGK